MRDQHIREKNGKYAEYTRCELCNGKVGDNYYSDSRVDSKFHGFGLVLCKKCAFQLMDLSDDEAYRLLIEAYEKITHKKVASIYKTPGKENV